MIALITHVTHTVHIQRSGRIIWIMEQRLEGFKRGATERRMESGKWGGGGVKNWVCHEGNGSRSVFSTRYSEQSRRSLKIIIVTSCVTSQATTVNISGRNSGEVLYLRLETLKSQVIQPLRNQVAFVYPKTSPNPFRTHLVSARFV